MEGVPFSPSRPTPKMNEQTRFWIATWNEQDFTDTDFAEQNFRDTAELPGVAGVIGQLERGESGNYHLQFVIKFQRSRKLSWIKNNINEYAHWERVQDIQASIAYVTKEDTRVAGPWTVGDIADRHGQRSDIQQLQADIRGGSSLREIAEDHLQFYLRYPRAITSYILMQQVPRNWEMEVHVLWGATGTGKTRTVYDRATRDDFRVYPLSQNYQGGVVWWDSYDNEEIVLIDDFYGWLPISYLLKLLDRYPFLIRTQAGHLQFTSKIIYITSNTDPREWYPNAPDEVRAALRRRFTNVTHFNASL